MMSICYCFFSIVSSFSKNFGDTLLMPKFSVKLWMYQSDAYTYIVRNFLDCESSCRTTCSVTFIPACWRPIWTWFTVEEYVAIFKAIVPHFYTYSAQWHHSRKPLESCNSFYLGIIKLFTEFNTISLLKCFCHFTKTKFWKLFTTRFHMLVPATDTFCGQKKIRDYTWVSPPHLHWRKSPVLHWFMLEKIRFDTFWHTGYRRW